MPKILLCDPSKNYDIKKILESSGVSDFNIFDIPEIEKARESVKIERPDFMIVGYGFRDTSSDAEKFIKENRGIPSVILLYPSERGLFRQMKIAGIEPLYRDEINMLGKIIERVYKKSDSVNV